MIDELFLHEKLATLSQYVDELRTIAARSLQEYEQDLFVKRTGERTVELIVECAVDINNYLSTLHMRWGQGKERKKEIREQGRGGEQEKRGS